MRAFVKGEERPPLVVKRTLDDGDAPARGLSALEGGRAARVGSLGRGVVEKRCSLNVPACALRGEVPGSGDAALRAKSHTLLNLKHVKLERALLAAHREFPQPAASDAGRQRGETLDEGRGGEHPIVGVAARLQNAGGGVHRVADERNLSPQGPELADRNRAAVQGGAE